MPTEKIIVEPEVNYDETFIEQVEIYMNQEDYIYLSADKTLLIDKHMIPIFDIAEAKYSMISETQRDNAYLFLSKGAHIINRLLKVIHNLESR